MISVTGSVLVYWNELYRSVTPQPILSTGSRPAINRRATYGRRHALVSRISSGRISLPRNLDQAAEIGLRRGDRLKHRLFDPHSGSDLGDSVPTGMRLVAFILDLHDNLLAGPTGRNVNGVGAFAVLAVAISGMAIWWPGIKTWRRSLTLHRGVGMEAPHLALAQHDRLLELGFRLDSWAERNLSLHSEQIQEIADRLQPPLSQPAAYRFVDQIIYWLAYLHFGRINGIGIPCHGPGLCDQTTKAIWAIFGLAPAAMFVTGAIMWWNRVLRPRLAATSERR